MAVRRSPDELVVALVGQPNCGKSTVFNAAAGFKVNTGNFAGTSVTYAETVVRFEGRMIRLVDLPGTYSISSHDPAERVARDFLLSGEVDVVLNVADASLLSRSLELTLLLMEMRIPMVVCLNMMDEAERKGIAIDLPKLSELTGVPILPGVAVRGTGIDDVFREVLRMKAADYHPVTPHYDRDIEDGLARILRVYPEALRQAWPLDERFVALRLLEMDGEFEKRVGAVDAAFLQHARGERKRLAEMHGWPEAGVLGSHRHGLVLDLYEQVATHQRRAHIGMRERIDRIITNPVGGFVTVIGSLVLTFYLAIFLGNQIAALMSGPTTALMDRVHAMPPGILASMLSGLVDGVVAGAGIVLPYLLPLLLLLSIYEDTGLLPRIAFMVDGVLHRVGLHGKSVVPLILGFGCNVPAIMATRNLENARDRYLTMLVLPFVTCSARSVVILALAGKYLGAWWAAGLYLLGVAVAMLVSWFVSKLQKMPALGVVMEVPPLRRPYWGILSKKIWYRLREFVTVAWPVLLVSSVVMSALSFIGVDKPINMLFAPLTIGVLKLPVAVGIALFLGILRKELTLLMLGAALGVVDPGSVLTHGQILSLVLFTMFYIPCVATLTTLAKEGGWKTAGVSAALNFGVAVLIAGIVAHLAPLGA